MQSGVKIKPLDPDKLTRAIFPDPNGPFSVIHPEYITNLKHQIDGDTLSGRVEFKATGGIYEGAFGFEAVRAGSDADGWLINAFVLGDDNLRLERKGENQPWKLNPPAPGEGHGSQP